MARLKNKPAKENNKTVLKKPDTTPYFLPYQREWLSNRNPVKIWEKSRRIGATYVQAYEDVEDCVSKTVPQVWFSSADESAGKEYIDYCAMWAKVFNVVAEAFDEEVLDNGSKIQVLGIKFANGTKITALSSNPKGFRSKGGKVILDEFAFHKSAKELWDAASPATTWGYPIRILSTHNGKQCLYYRQLQKAEENGWWKFSVTIHEAVRQGLADKITGKKLSDEERAAWVEALRKKVGSISTWKQEYECEAEDGVSAFLTYELISKAENKSCRLALNASVMDLKEWTSERDTLYLGMDIARKKHLSVIWIISADADFNLTMAVVELEKTPFDIQKSILFSFLELPQIRRACIDATGIGMNLAEDAERRFGEKVESVMFTNASKQEMATQLFLKFEAGHIAIPASDLIQQDLHSVKKIVTASGNIRYDQSNDDDSDKKENDGHADRFWALALAVHAATTSPEAFLPKSGRRRESNSILKGY